MNRLFKKILFLIIPFLVILLFAEARLRNIRTIYDRKKEEFEKNLSETELLVLGNSHAENSIVPSLLSDKGYNLSLPSQSLFYNEKILANYLPRLKKLKRVIIGVDFHSYYFIDQEQSAFHNDKTFAVSKRYYDYRLSSENLSFFFFVYGAFPSIGYLLHPPRPAWLEKGFEPLLSADSSAINDRTGFIRAAAHNALAEKNKKLQPVLEASLAGMISLLIKNNIQPVLVTTPVFHTYYDQLNKKLLLENERITDSIAARYHVPYFNFMVVPEFDISNFSDNDHLSATGAVKFTKLLRQFIL